MGETCGDPQHVPVLGGERQGVPCSEPGRVAAEVDGDVEDLALQHANEFSLGLADLVVEAAKDVLVGERLIVLDEVRIGNELVEGGLVEALEEVAPVVAIDFGFEEQKSGGVFSDDLHERRIDARAVGNGVAGFQMKEARSLPESGIEFMNYSAVAREFRRGWARLVLC